MPFRFRRGARITAGRDTIRPTISARETLGQRLLSAAAVLAILWCFGSLLVVGAAVNHARQAAGWLARIKTG
jgi:hypothetical protein